MDIAITSLCPITISSFEVPMELKPMMRYLALVFGKVLHVNEGEYYNPTSMTRIVVLFDLANPIVEEAHYLVGRKYTINVYFLYVPNRCNSSHTIGHMYRDSPKKIGELGGKTKGHRSERNGPRENES